jgi:mono/diheme cytochrome c family protein
VYLSKAPGISKANAQRYLAEEDDPEKRGIPRDDLSLLARDADEQHLAKGQVTDNKLLWYVGKKAIGRMGCYACHDVPGFETAKPIGVGLNDWGKKDPERLAFEDADSFVKGHFHLTEPEWRSWKELDARYDLLKAREQQGVLTSLEKKQFQELAFVGERRELQADANKLRIKKREGALSDEEEEKLKGLEKKLDDLESGIERRGWEVEDGKKPFERIFYEALRHQTDAGPAHPTREGFLHLKLADPRSFDYNRKRDWDDRLRMPQFQFARRRLPPLKKLRDESDDDFEARKKKAEDDFRVRQRREEAEAREAVMTFVLGLVAEPVNAKYVYTPSADRRDEVMGRQVLDKYNCAGCHQVRSGVYEFRPSEATVKRLDGTPEPTAADFSFPGHRAWTGVAPTSADRLTAHGNQPRMMVDPDTNVEVLRVRLTDALRYTTEKKQTRKKQTRDLTAGNDVEIVANDVLFRSDPFGGTFAELLLDYTLRTNLDLRLTKDTPDNKISEGRTLLPPPLIREGERVQPHWLYQFLLDPKPIRPQVKLRMPRFNMSADEAKALVSYFTAVERRNNPDAGAAAYAAIPQRDTKFWEDKTREYVGRLDKKALEQRLKELGPVWDLVLREEIAKLGRQILVAEDDLKRAKEAEDKETDKEKKKALTAKREEAEKGLAALKQQQKDVEKKQKDKDYEALNKQWREQDAYAADGYRLLIGHASGICLSCHSVGGVGDRKAPPLDLAFERLRPEWTARWLSAPPAMFGYNPTMPANFKRNERISQELFDGDAPAQIRALRDVLMDLPRIANVPANRYYRRGPAGGP